MDAEEKASLLAKIDTLKSENHWLCGENDRLFSELFKSKMLVHGMIEEAWGNRHPNAPPRGLTYVCKECCTCCLGPGSLYPIDTTINGS